MADLATFIPERQKPVGPVETFTAAKGATETRQMTTDDAAMILLRYANGARGVMSTSQVSLGRKNELTWEMAGSHASAAWNSEDAGSPVDRPPRRAQPDPSARCQSDECGRARGGGPACRAIPRALPTRSPRSSARSIATWRAGGRQGTSTWATFEDGHYEMRFCEAVQASACTGTWTEI